MIGTAEANEQLTEAALAGDQDALGRLLASHQQLAYSVAFRLLGSDADAADAVQKTATAAIAVAATRIDPSIERWHSSMGKPCAAETCMSARGSACS